MPLDPSLLVGRRFDQVEQQYAERDAILYALGIGLGSDPLDPGQLAFVYGQPLKVFPTLPVVLATGGLWAREAWTGIDWKRMLHGEQGLQVHRPLPPAGRVVSRLRVDSVVDKGAGRGALIHTSRELIDATTGEKYSTVTATLFCRGDGGAGSAVGSPGGVPELHPVPDRPADVEVTLPTSPQAALIYRLSGDDNPLHADPAVAAEAGFRAPILHGLCTYGVAAHALLRALCDYRPEPVRRLDVRFSAPVWPGESITTRIWREGPGRAAFRCLVAERSAVVIDNGRFEYDP